MSPTCRTCWLATLSDVDRQRVAAEPITSCVHLCREHQTQMDKMLAALPKIEYVKADMRRDFTPSTRSGPDAGATQKGDDR